MSLAVILQFAGLAVTLIIGLVILYAIFEMREVYAEQRDKFLSAVAALEEMRRLQPEFLAIAEKVQADSQRFQDMAAQIERAVSQLATNINTMARTAVGNDGAAFETLGKHLELQQRDTQLHAARIDEVVRILNEIAEGVAGLDKMRIAQLGRQVESARLRRDVLANDSSLRFNLLRDWIKANALAILRRAGMPWNSPRDLINVVPDSFEAEAEILDNSILLIGTRGFSEQAALPLRQLDQDSQYFSWFEHPSNGSTNGTDPAVIVRSNGSWKVIQKGAAGPGLAR